MALAFVTRLLRGSDAHAAALERPVHHAVPEPSPLQDFQAQAVHKRALLRLEIFTNQLPEKITSLSPSDVEVHRCGNEHATCITAELNDVKVKLYVTPTGASFKGKEILPALLFITGPGAKEMEVNQGNPFLTPQLLHACIDGFKQLLGEKFPQVKPIRSRSSLYGEQRENLSPDLATLKSDLVDIVTESLQSSWHKSTHVYIGERGNDPYGEFIDIPLEGGFLRLEKRDGFMVSVSGNGWMMPLLTGVPAKALYETAIERYRDYIQTRREAAVVLDADLVAAVNETSKADWTASDDGDYRLYTATVRGIQLQLAELKGSKPPCFPRYLRPNVCMEPVGGESPYLHVGHTIRAEAAVKRVKEIMSESESR